MNLVLLNRLVRANYFVTRIFIFLKYFYSCKVNLKHICLRSSLHMVLCSVFIGESAHTIVRELSISLTADFTRREIVLDVVSYIIVESL